MVSLCLLIQKKFWWVQNICFLFFVFCFFVFCFVFSISYSCNLLLFLFFIVSHRICVITKVLCLRCSVC